MDNLLHIIYLIIGFVFLIKGADFFVVSSGSIARQFKVSPLIIGLTLVAFGTSLPEIAVSVVSSISARQQGVTADIALGNVIGSNITNLTLILGFTAIMAPVLINKNAFKKEFPFLILVSLVFAGMAHFFQADAQIVWWEALILMVFFLWYMKIMFATAKDEPSIEEFKVLNMRKAIILLLIGLIGVALGGYLVTKGAEFIAINFLYTNFDMSRARATTLVGLSVVALGTSLPELVTSVVAAKKGENEIAFGNVIGSNIFNTLLVVGLSGLVTPLAISSDVLFDIFPMILITLLVVLFAYTGKKISKIEGIWLVLTYFAYMAFIIIRAIASF
jgi:cation:H+ antiporter